MIDGQNNLSGGLDYAETLLTEEYCDSRFPKGQRTIITPAGDKFSFDDITAFYSKKDDISAGINLIAKGKLYKLDEVSCRFGDEKIFRWLFDYVQVLQHFLKFNEIDCVGFFKGRTICISPKAKCDFRIDRNCLYVVIPEGGGELYIPVGDFRTYDSAVKFRDDLKAQMIFER